MVATDLHAGGGRVTCGRTSRTMCSTFMRSWGAERAARSDMKSLSYHACPLLTATLGTQTPSERQPSAGGTAVSGRERSAEHQDGAPWTPRYVSPNSAVRLRPNPPVWTGISRTEREKQSALELPRHRSRSPRFLQCPAYVGKGRTTPRGVMEGSRIARSKKDLLTSAAKPKLHWHDVRRLRVVDSCFFTRATAAATLLTIGLTAVRVADTLNARI